MIADYLRAAMCGVKMSFFLTAVERNGFVPAIMRDFEARKISRAVTMCLEYIGKSRTPNMLFRRFDETVFFIQHLGNHAKHPAQRDAAISAVQAVVQQKSAIFSSFIRLWKCTGQSGYLMMMNKRANELPIKTRLYLDICMSDKQVYRCCRVVFPETQKSYCYFAGDNDLVPGDDVIVPAGEENLLKIARVIGIEEYSPDTLPIPLEITKSVIRRADNPEAMSGVEM